MGWNAIKERAFFADFGEDVRKIIRKGRMSLLKGIFKGMQSIKTKELFSFGIKQGKKLITDSFNNTYILTALKKEIKNLEKQEDESILAKMGMGSQKGFFTSVGNKLASFGERVLKGVGTLGLSELIRTRGEIKERAFFSDFVITSRQIIRKGRIKLLEGVLKGMKKTTSKGMYKKGLEIGQAYGQSIADSFKIKIENILIPESKAIASPIDVNSQESKEKVEAVKSGQQRRPSYNGPLGEIINLLSDIAENTSTIKNLPKALSEVGSGASADSAEKEKADRYASLNKVNNANFFTQGNDSESLKKVYRKEPSNVMRLAAGY
jgi:hypothetical protein